MSSGAGGATTGADLAFACDLGLDLDFFGFDVDVEAEVDFGLGWVFWG
jgi:hypothetical protein